MQNISSKIIHVIKQFPKIADFNNLGSSANQISLTYTCQTVVIDFYQGGSTFI